MLAPWTSIVFPRCPSSCHSGVSSAVTGGRSMSWRVSGLSQADNTSGLVEQQDEALGGEREQRVLLQLREVHPDTLAGGEVKEAAAAGAGRGLVEHDPLPMISGRLSRGEVHREGHSVAASIDGKVSGLGIPIASPWLDPTAAELDGSGWETT